MASGSPLLKAGIKKAVLTSLGHIEPEVFGALVPRSEVHDLGGDRLTGHLRLNVEQVLLAGHLFKSCNSGLASSLCSIQTDAAGRGYLGIGIWSDECGYNYWHSWWHFGVQAELI